MKKNNFKIVFLVFAFLFIFGFGYSVGKNSVVCKTCAPERVDFSLFWETWVRVHKMFVDPSKLDDQNMIYGAISGMVNAIGDPYTVFMKPETSQNFLDEVTGQFQGIGVEIGVKNGQLQVISPLEGTPAKRAGLRAEDKIVKINDKPSLDMTVDEAVKNIKGPMGTEVILTIARSGIEKTFDVKIVRAIINIPSLKWELKGDKKDIAYIQLYQFSEKASGDFRNAVTQISKTGAKKIILDLRDNPGGYLEVSKDIAGWFLKKGQVVAIEDFKNKEKQIIYKAEGNSIFSGIPMIVLINAGSASASEILAAALRDNRGIKLVGVKSYGKGSVQELENLSGNSSLKVTVANWLTPKGSHISGVGLEPDVKVEITEEQYKNGQDPQMEKAIEILNSLD